MDGGLMQLLSNHHRSPLPLWEWWSFINLFTALVSFKDGSLEALINAILFVCTIVCIILRDTCGEGGECVKANIVNTGDDLFLQCSVREISHGRMEK